MEEKKELYKNKTINMNKKTKLLKNVVAERDLVIDELNKENERVNQNIPEY